MVGKPIHSCPPCPKVRVSLRRPVGLLLSSSRVRTAIHYLVRSNNIKAFVQEHERVKKSGREEFDGFPCWAKNADDEAFCREALGK